MQNLNKIHDSRLIRNLIIRLLFSFQDYLTLHDFGQLSSFWLDLAVYILQNWNLVFSHLLDLLSILILPSLILSISLSFVTSPTPMLLTKK